MLFSFGEIIRQIIKLFLFDDIHTFESDLIL